MTLRSNIGRGDNAVVSFLGPRPAHAVPGDYKIGGGARVTVTIWTRCNETASIGRFDVTQDRALLGTATPLLSRAGPGSDCQVFEHSCTITCPAPIASCRHIEGG
jgi:hypothetical protein